MKMTSCNINFSSSVPLFGLMFFMSSFIPSSHEMFIPSSASHQRSNSSSHWPPFLSSDFEGLDDMNVLRSNDTKVYECIRIPKKISMCHNIDYPTMMIPNHLGHDTFLEIDMQARVWEPLIGLQCHPDTRIFLCSLFSPICSAVPILPCRSLCEQVQANCEPRLRAYNISWPSEMDCSQYPVDNGLCVPLQASKTYAEDLQLTCPTCNPAHTLENIVDNFCQADFVFRANFKMTKGSLLEFSEDKWFKPEDGNTTGLVLSNVTLNEDDACCAKNFTKNAQYLVMGKKCGDKIVLSFAMKWDPMDKILENAVKMYSRIDCSDPMSVSQIWDEIPLEDDAEQRDNGASTEADLIISQNDLRSRRGTMEEEDDDEDEEEEPLTLPVVVTAKYHGETLREIDEIPLS